VNSVVPGSCSGGKHTVLSFQSLPTQLLVCFSLSTLAFGLGHARMECDAWCEDAHLNVGYGWSSEHDANSGV